METSSQSCSFSLRSHSELILPTAFFLYFSFLDYSAETQHQERLNAHKNSQGPSEVEISTHKLIWVKQTGNRIWQRKADGTNRQKTTSAFPIYMKVKEWVWSMPSFLNISHSHLNTVNSSDGCQASLPGSHVHVHTTFLVVPKGPKPLSASVCKKLQLW